MGRIGFPGRSRPEALRGADPDAREAVDRLEVRTRWLLALRDGDFFFLKGVLNRDSLLGAAGRSPFVFCACNAPLKANITTTNKSNRRMVSGTLVGVDSKKRFDV